MPDFRHLFSRYDVAGDKISANGEEDHQRALEAYRLIVDSQIRLAQAQQAAIASIPLVGVPPLRHVMAGKLLREACDAHLEEEARGLQSTQTVNEKRVLFQEFIDCFGNVALNDITQTEITDRWRKVEFARPNKKNPTAKVGVARLEKRRGYLAKFFDWALKGRIYSGDNPAKQAMATKAQIKNNRQSYAEFTADDLAKLFTPTFLKDMNKPDWYWIPLMGLFTGARLNELADLKIKSFSEIENTKVFEIMHAKNTSSKRVVPIHHQLVDLGLWDYVQALKLRGETHLFPHRPVTDQTKQTGRGKSVGRQWGQWVTKCGIDDKRKVFHSFRSTVITDLHNLSSHHPSIRKVVGHSTVGMSGVHGEYVRDTWLTTLKKTIEVLKFPSINFSQLRLADPTFMKFFEQVTATSQDPKNIASAERLRNHLAARLARESRSVRSLQKPTAV